VDVDADVRVVEGGVENASAEMVREAAVRCELGVKGPRMAVEGESPSRGGEDDCHRRRKKKR